MQNDVELLDVLKRKTQQSDELDFLFGRVFAAQKLNESTISFNNRMVGLRANGMLVYFSQISDEIKNNQIESIRQIPKAGVYLNQTKCILKKELQFQEITLQFLQCQVFYFDNDPNGYIKYPKSRKPQSWVFKIDNTDIRLDLNRQKTFTRIREPSRKTEKEDDNLLDQQLQLENKQRKTLFAQMQKEQQVKQKADQQSKIQAQNIIEEELLKKKQEQQKQTQIQQKQQLLQSQFNFRYLSLWEQIQMYKDDQDEMLKSELKLFHLINEFNQVCQTICINLCSQTQQLQQYYLENNIQIYIQNQGISMNQKFRNNSILSDALLQLKILIKTNLVVPLTCLIYYQQYKFYCIANYQQEDIKNIEDVSQLNTLCHLLNMIPDLSQRVCTLDQGVIAEIKKQLSDQYSIAPNTNFLLDVEQFFPQNMRLEVVIEHCPTPLKKSSEEYDQDHVLAQQMIDQELFIKLIMDFQDLKILPVDSKGLAIIVHSYGIQMKYLGKIATQSKSLHIQQLCIMDMIGRISKQIMREQQEEQYSEIVKDYVNLIFQDSQETKQFWNEVLRNLIIKKFEYDIGLYPVQLPFGGLLNCLEYHLNFSVEKSVQLQNKFIINSFKLTIRTKTYEFKSTKLQMIAKANTKAGLSVRLSLEQILSNGQSTIATHSLASVFETNKKYAIEMLQKAFQQDQKNKLNIFQIIPLQMLLKQTKDFVYFDESLQIIEYQLGLYHPLNASIYLTAAQIYTQQGKIQDSLLLLQSSLNALLKNFGNTHQMIGLVKFEIANLYEQQNQYCESIQLYEQCILNFNDRAMIDQIQLKMGRLHLSFLDYHKAIICIEQIKEQTQESLFIASICEEKLQKDTKYSEQLFSQIKQNMKFEINQDYYYQCIVTIFSHQLQLQDEKLKKYLLKLYYCLKDNNKIVDLEYQQQVILNHVDNLNALFISMFLVFKGYEGQLYYNKHLYSEFNSVLESIKDEQLHKNIRFFNYFIWLLQENLLEYIQ